MPSTKSTLSLVAIAILLFFSVNLLGSKLLGGMRADLTAENLNTLSDGAREIAKTLEEPIQLDLYYSRSTGNDLPPFKAHAERVIDLLEELQRASGGRLELTLLDPEPFSDAEDEAVLAGVRGVPVNDAGDMFYLGLVAENSVGEREVQPFLNPAQERFLEYEVARMLKSLDQPTRPKLGLISSLPVMGGPPPMALPGQPPAPGAQPWLFTQLFGDLFEIEDLGSSPEEIPEGTDVLLLIHPQGLSDASLYAIDQFALGGGRIVAAVDPWCEAQAPEPGQQPFEMDRTSSLGPLLGAWGIELRPRLLAADRAQALPVQVRGRSGQPESLDFPLYLNVAEDQMDDGSPATANLSRVVLAYPGILDATADAATELLPLLTTTPESMPIELTRVQFGLDPQAIVNDFAPGAEELVLAARISGPIASAFPDGRPDAAAAEGEDAEAPESAADPNHLSASVRDLEAIVIADADFLQDNYWTSQDMFAQMFGSVTKSADNADLVLNAAELLAGDEALISIRARGQYDRPFERVVELERDADARYRMEAQQLEESLRATEARIAELQQERGDSSSVLLTDEQVAELEQFQQQRVDTRKQLRDVQLELRRDKERMWTRIKLANVALWPLAVGLLAFTTGALRRRGQQAKKA